MSTIGSGPGLASGQTLEPVSRVTASAPIAPNAAPGNPATTNTATPAQTVVTTTAAGAAPVVADRVAPSKKAIAAGTYPVIPTKIADAMIAAQLLLRTPQ